jgi:hypothetical protein
VHNNNGRARAVDREPRIPLIVVCGGRVRDQVLVGPFDGVTDERLEPRWNKGKAVDIDMMGDGR